MKKPEYKWRWSMSVLKASEGGGGTGTFVRALKNKRGIHGYTDHSPYMGHTAIVIETDTVANMRRALKIIKDYGYIDSVSDEMRDMKRPYGW